jgi:transcription initiation factor TFIID TATA-box-binding protein
MKQEVILTNVTALVDTGVEFDLFMISQKVANCSFNTRRLPAVILRKIQPKCTLLIFKSGKIMSLGAQSEKDA